jgi:hypothetical protein
VEGEFCELPFLGILGSSLYKYSANFAVTEF